MPNPNQGMFKVKFDKPYLGQSLIILDILGRIVKEISLAEEKELFINANGLMPGLYMVKVSNGPTAKMMVKL